MNTIPEANLPALAAGKSIAHIRAIDNDDNPVNATPTQAAAAIAPAIAPMLGIDYSILTEQLIPGEYWLGFDGTRKQVYVKTYRHTIPTSIDGMSVWPGITGTEPYRIYSIDENITAERIEVVNASFSIDDTYDGTNYKLVLGAAGQLFGRLKTTSTLVFGTTIIVTIKYIKR